jgi:hypothetical protein
MELKPDFAFTPLPAIERPLRFSSVHTADNPLGLLEGLKGTWMGNGFNVIWRPFQGGPPDQDRFLELNLTEETLRFEEIPGAIPNRGLLQPDINMFGLWYLQTIADANIKDANGKPSGLHLEPGIWATVPQTEHPQEVPTVVRMASIPHGTTVIAQGVAFQSPEGPRIQDINITPFVIGNPAKLITTFPEPNLSNPSEFRTPPEGWSASIKPSSTTRIWFSSVPWRGKRSKLRSCSMSHRIKALRFLAEGSQTRRFYKEAPVKGPMLRLRSSERRSGSKPCRAQLRTAQIFTNCNIHRPCC